LIASTGNVPHCLNAGGTKRLDFESETMIAHTLKGEGFDASEDGTGRGTPIVTVVSSGRGWWDESNVAATIRSQDSVNKADTLAVAFDCKATDAQPGDISPTMRSMSHDKSHANAGGQVAVAKSAVRRLTPRECDRLMGFPDDYTLVEYRGKPAADGPRYKSLGNSMAVNCMRWIGRRIEIVEQVEAA